MASTFETVTRRRFIGWSRALVAALGSRPMLASSVEPAALSSGEDYYSKLGVEKIINAAGTYTYLTAAVMPPRCSALRAGRRFIPSFSRIYIALPENTWRSVYGVRAP